MESSGRTPHAGVLLVCLLLVAPLASGGPSGVAVDPEPRVAYQYEESSMRFGLRVVRDAAGKPTSTHLTYSQNGSTNNTILRIDGKESGFGAGAGKWLERGSKLAELTRHAVNGSSSTWLIDDLAVTQILEIVPSKQPVEIKPGVQQRLLDTCLIRYVVENKSPKPRKVGLRVMIDTQIGNNDGVPFTVPGLGLVDTMKDFPTAKEVPEFVQALETGKLLKPGTVGHVSLKIAGLEAPDRVSLTRWPGGAAPWEVPLRPITGDSSIVLYWQERELQPGKRRELGFAYGLGSISSSERTGHLALTVDGQFEVGQLFTATAYVNNPSKGEALTLVLPKGLERASGAEQEPVPPLAPQAKEGNSIVSWKIKALAPGQSTIKVRSSLGLEATTSVTIVAASSAVPKTKPKPKTDPWSAVDALDALAMSVRLIPERLEMDVDEDGTVTSRDAAVILQRVATQLGKSKRP